jgi:hypothetical protein
LAFMNQNLLRREGRCQREWQSYDFADIDRLSLLVIYINADILEIDE